MLRAFFLGMLLLGSSAAIACPMADKAEFESKAKVVKESKGAKTSFVLTGMTCGGCSSKVYDALKKVDGVIAAAVDYQSGRVEVAFQSKKTNRAKLQKILETIGYKLKKS